MRYHLLAVTVQSAVHITLQHADVAIVIIVQYLVVLTRHNQFAVLVLQTSLSRVIVHDNKSGYVHVMLPL